MASNSKAFVSQKFPLSGSVPIRAPLTLDDDDDDSQFDVSIDDDDDATLSDTASAYSHSDDFKTPTFLVAEDDPEPHFASQQQEYEEDDEEEEGSLLVQLPAINEAPLRVMPFAHLSIHDDEEEVLSVVRVTENFVGAPRIKLLDVEDGNAENLMLMNSLPVSQSLLEDKLTFSSDMGSDIFIEDENEISNVRINEELVVDEHGLDEVLGIRVACDVDSIATDEDVMSQGSQDSCLNNEQVGKVRVVLNELEMGGIELYGEDRNEGIMVRVIETDTILQNKEEVHTSEIIDMVEGTSIMIGDASLLKSSAEDYNHSMKSSAEDYNHSIMLNQNTTVEQEQNSQIHGMTGEPLSDAFAENIEYSTTTRRNACNGSQAAASDQETEREKLVSITKSLIISEAKLHDYSAGFESNDDTCGGNRIQDVESSEHFDPILLQECAYLENDLSETVLGVVQEDGLICDYHSHINGETLNSREIVKKEVTINTVSEESKRDGSASDEDVEGFMEQISALSFLLGSKGSGKNSQEEQTVRSSHGKMNLPKDDVKSESIYVHSGGESDSNTVTVTSADESSLIFLKDPASFSSSPHCDAQAGFQHNISEKEKEKIQRIQTISVKFLRLVQRIDLSLEEPLVSKVLCRLVADIGRRSNQEFVISSVKTSAKKLEEDCQEDLDFSLNILVLGKSGVGKSATINSIFGDKKVMTNAFEPATTSVKEVSGTIYGLKIRILDTPGLRPSIKEQAFNRRILSSVKRYTKKFPPDVILYVDRVDSQARDLNDLPILRSITSSLSPSIWQHAIVTLTHAASTLLDGSSGSPLSHEVFVAQKPYLVQQSITKAVGDLCQLSPSFMCPVSLVENNPLYGNNISGDCVLPNGLRWRSQLLALCISLKILSEASAVSGPQTLFNHWKHFFFQDHSQPLCHPFSSLLQSSAHLKFSANWN